MIQEYIRKYRSKGILVDTNILLLLFIGGVSKSYISSFKRTATYTEEDYDILMSLIGNFNSLVVTPNILTEVSNLSNGLYGERLGLFYDVFSKSLSVISEIYVDSLSLSNISGFHEYGLADVSIVSVAKENYLVLTDDLRFSAFAMRNGVDVINFNNIRSAS